MAKTSSKASERGDRLAKGAKMDVPKEERKRIRDRRKHLEWRQEDLAARIGVSPATISNLETGGRTGEDQSYKAVYAEVVRLLEVGDLAGSSDKRFRRVVQKLLKLDERGWEAVEAMLDVQLKPR